MTHKEFAARWRATLRGRMTLVGIVLLPVLLPLAVLLYWFFSGSFFEMVAGDTWHIKALRVFNRLVIPGGLVLLFAFFLAVKRLHRRHGFVCPECDRVFLPFHIQNVLSGGHCCFCGERVLEEDPPQPPDRAMQ